VRPGALYQLYPSWTSELDDVVQSRYRSKNRRADSHLHPIFEAEFRKNIPAGLVGPFVAPPKVLAARPQTDRWQLVATKVVSDNRPHLSIPASCHKSCLRQPAGL